MVNAGAGEGSMQRAVVAKTSYSDEELALKRRHFAQILQSIELLHRRFLDVITAELGRREKALSAVQALILSHASDRPLSLGQLQALGHYEGTNLSYNVGKLAESGYIILSRPEWDKRSSVIGLTADGQEVASLIARTIDEHSASLAGIGITDDELSLITRTLKGLHRLWSA
jgi:DNA-binding MarR family transcriptional regulator